MNCRRPIVILSQLLVCTSTLAAHELCAVKPQWTKLHAIPWKQPLIRRHALDAVFAAMAYEAGDSPPYAIGQSWKAMPSKGHPSGLSTKIFVNEAERRVVLAFRGTEFTSLKDWLQNIAGTQIGPSDSVVKEVFRDYPGYKVRLVGHSLGGALALEMSHRHPSVEAVAFLTAPIATAVRGKPAYRVIFREEWEPLAIIRGNPSGRKDWGVRREVLMDFTGGFLFSNLFTQHGMDRYAMNLLALAGTRSPELQHLFKQTCRA